MSVDPETHLLSLINSHKNLPKSYYITIQHPYYAFDNNLQLLSSAISLHAKPSENTISDAVNYDNLESGYMNEIKREKLREYTNYKFSSSQSHLSLPAMSLRSFLKTSSYDNLEAHKVTSFVVVIPAQSVIDLCYIFRTSPLHNDKHSFIALPKMAQHGLENMYSRNMQSRRKAYHKLTQYFSPTPTTSISDDSQEAFVPCRACTVCMKTNTSDNANNIRLEGQCSQYNHTISDVGTIEQCISYDQSILIEHLGAENFLDLEHVGKCLTSDVTVLSTKHITTFPSPLHDTLKSSLFTMLKSSISQNNTDSEIMEYINQYEAYNFQAPFTPSHMRNNDSTMVNAESMDGNKNMVENNMLLYSSLLHEVTTITGIPKIPILSSPFLSSGTFLCTQGFGGTLSHFLPQTRHAVDLRCPPKTPIVAIAPGEIVSIQSSTRVVGCHISNLFAWNSVMLKIHARDLDFIDMASLQRYTVLHAQENEINDVKDINNIRSIDDKRKLLAHLLQQTLIKEFSTTPLTTSTSAPTSIPTSGVGMVDDDDYYYVEYVHLSPDSITVQSGQKVDKGDIIAYSGAAGFCPDAHVHLQVSNSGADSAFTIPFVFTTSNNTNQTRTHIQDKIVSCYVPFAGTFFKSIGSLYSLHGKKEALFTNIIATYMNKHLQECQEHDSNIASVGSVSEDTSSLTNSISDKQINHLQTEGRPLNAALAALDLSGSAGISKNMLNDGKSASVKTTVTTKKSTVANTGGTTNKKSKLKPRPKKIVTKPCDPNTILLSIANNLPQTIIQYISKTKSTSLMGLQAGIQKVKNTICGPTTISETTTTQQREIVQYETMQQAKVMKFKSSTNFTQFTKDTIHEFTNSDVQFVYTPYVSYTVASIIAQYCGVDEIMNL